MAEKVVTTGGAEFVGSQFTYQMANEVYDVTLIDDMSFGYQSNLSVGGLSFEMFVNLNIPTASPKTSTTQNN